jgi:hypothetical protein
MEAASKLMVFLEEVQAPIHHVEETEKPVMNETTKNILALYLCTDFVPILLSDFSHIPNFTSLKGIEMQG